MSSSILPRSTRAFGAGLFAVVAFAVASFLTPILLGTFDGRRALALPLPFFAALCAYAWAWVLHPGAAAPSYGTVRGVCIALSAYLSFGAVYSGYLQWAIPPGPRRGEGLPLLLIAFVWTPFPWLSLFAGALAGRIHLASARARIRAAMQAWVSAMVRGGAAAREAYTSLAARAANPTLLPRWTLVVSNGLLLAGTAFGFLAARVGPASSGEHDDPALLVFPATVALVLGAVGWLLGRWLIARAAPRRRLVLLLVSAAAACAAAALFVARVA